MRNKLYAVALLGLSMFAISSCGSENKTNNEVVLDDLEYMETGFDSGYNQGSSEARNPYFTSTYPAIKYINNQDELNLEIYLGFGRELLDTFKLDVDSGHLYFDSNQELTLKLFRKIEWDAAVSTPKTVPTQPITEEIFECKQTLGYFMSDQFDKSLKNLKYEENVTLEDLKENYYESVFDNEYELEEDENGEYYRNYDLSRYRSYAILSYWFTLSCEDNNYIKYYFTYESGYQNPFNQRKKYDEINVLYFSSTPIFLYIIDEKIVTFWSVDNVKHYY